MSTELEALYGRPAQLGVRGSSSTLRMLGDLDPTALVAIASPGVGAERSLLMSAARLKALQEGAGGDGTRGLQTWRLYRGPLSVGLVLGGAKLLTSLLSAALKNPVVGRIAKNAMGRAEDYLAASFNGLRPSQVKTWLPKLERLALGLGKSAKHGVSLEFWQDGWFRQPSFWEGRTPKAGEALVVPGLCADIRKLAAPVAGEWEARNLAGSNEPQRLWLVRRPLLSATVAEVADALQRVLGSRHLDEFHVIAHSTGGFVTEHLWRERLEQMRGADAGGTDRLPRRYIAVNAPFSRTIADDPLWGDLALNKLLGTTVDASKSGVVARIAKLASTDTVGIGEIGELLQGAFLLDVLKFIPNPMELPGLASIRPNRNADGHVVELNDEKQRGADCWEVVLATNLSERLNAALPGTEVVVGGGAQKSPEGLPPFLPHQSIAIPWTGSGAKHVVELVSELAIGEPHDWIAPVSAMRGPFPLGEVVLDELPDGVHHFNVLMCPEVAQEVVTPPAAAPLNPTDVEPLSPRVLQWMRTQRLRVMDATTVDKQLDALRSADGGSGTDSDGKRRVADTDWATDGAGDGYVRVPSSLEPLSTRVFEREGKPPEPGPDADAAAEHQDPVDARPWTARVLPLPPLAPFDDSLGRDAARTLHPLSGYDAVHRALHNAKWLPQEVQPVWCGIAGSKSRRLIVPTGPDTPLAGLQELCGVVVQPKHRAMLRSGQLAVLNLGLPDHPVAGAGCEVILVPIAPAHLFEPAAWSGHVQSAIRTLLTSKQQANTGCSSAEAIAIFLPDPGPHATVAQLAVAAIDGAIEGRAAAWRAQSLGKEKPGDWKDLGLRPFRLRIAVTWRDDFLELSSTLARFNQLTSLSAPPSVCIVENGGRKSAGDGYAGQRPVQLSQTGRRLAITVVQTDNPRVWRYTAMTARGLLREHHEVHPVLVDELIKEAKSSTIGAYRRALTIFPQRLRPLLHTHRHVELILDQRTERVPWEALCVDGQPLCARGSVIRRTGRWRDPSPRQGTTALIVGNPTGDLERASEEAVVVRDMLRNDHRLKYSELAPMGRIWRDGAVRTEDAPGSPDAQVSPPELRREILSSRHRIVHIASHGDKGAVKLGTDQFGNTVWLTADDVWRSEHVPELVVLNCCSIETDDMDQTDLARAFRDRGARVVVATGWSIRDSSAKLFAEKLYANLQAGDLLAEATLRARQALREEALRNPDEVKESDWTAYRVWGDGNWQLAVGSVGEPRLTQVAIERMDTPEQVEEALLTLQGQARCRARVVRGEETSGGACLPKLLADDLARLFCDLLRKAELQEAAVAYYASMGGNSDERGRIDLTGVLGLSRPVRPESLERLSSALEHRLGIACWDLPFLAVADGDNEQVPVANVGLSEAWTARIAEWASGRLAGEPPADGEPMRRVNALEKEEARKSRVMRVPWTPWRQFVEPSVPTDLKEWADALGSVPNLEAWGETVQPTDLRWAQRAARVLLRYQGARVARKMDRTIGKARGAAPVGELGAIAQLPEVDQVDLLERKARASGKVMH